ncbi:ribonuclease R [Gilvimarinus sp. SDUM040013]|uniref:Ribonuclease R n=1 Tax=Gilvimarinus gilvus TaxID=3058038 RepID=A0ABU4S2R0_9GAMM|nr:ribonuclease R [Gilvimarinus sp. SDUM040013]MDO3387228.1 ribonuclease R [Gilvimarinus sp. SDUM040013]MDX6850791.1 ribonuclease R [Gilvimarinus sp. SDUM040013]
MSKNRVPPADPFADREAQKYENPIPSRELILELLDRQPGPCTHPALCDLLELTSEDDIEALRRRLIAMARDGQLISNRRGAYARVDLMDVVRARVQGHRDGYGFAIPADGGDDIYLHNRQMRKVFDGDEVLVRLQGENYRGREEGAIIEVLTRNTKTLAGRFIKEDGVQFLSPENNRVTQDIMIAQGDEMGAVSGQIVVVEVTRQPEKQRPPQGRVIQVLGDHMAPGMEIKLAIESHGIPNQWGFEALAEADALPGEVAEGDKSGRVDLRELPFVTIDGEDARDFDDAVYCEAKKGGGWRLYVAIADVSHYVRPGSALDADSKHRATSVYFPDHVVPMLPEKISNGLCSLNPHVDRLVMVCEMTVSAQGLVSGYKFYEGIIHSHARLTYTQVGGVLAGDEALVGQLKDRLPEIHTLNDLYQQLREARSERGAIDFETVETRIVFNQDRKIDEIVPVRRNDAHKIIEECMLCANVSAARFLEQHDLKALYRVHQGPTAQKMENLREFLAELGLGLRGGDEPTSGDYQDLLAQVSDRPDANMIQTVMLRSLRQAVYQVENEGHFGLGYDAYAHFTSPIRRYPDLLVHRAIRSVVRSESASKHVVRIDGVKPIPLQKIFPYDITDMAALGEHCSLSERRADEATRDVVSWLKCEYLQDKVGDVFEGVVSSVTGFGLFVELVNIYVEGLVHVTSLPHDYYRFDAAKHRLVGERTRQVFGLGDELTVRVVRVSLDERKIDFELDAVKHKRRSSKAPASKGAGRSKSGKGGRKSPDSNGSHKSRHKSADIPKPRKRKLSNGPKTGAQADSKKKASQVRSTQAKPPAEKRSLLAQATAGLKKTLARFKKKP